MHVDKCGTEHRVATFKVTQEHGSFLHFGRSVIQKNVLFVQQAYLKI